MQPDYSSYSYVAPPNNQSPIREFLSRRNIFIILILLAIILIGWFGWQQLIYKKTVTFQASAGTLIQIGTYIDNEEGIQIDHVLGQSSQQGSVKLTPGTYAVTYSGDDYVRQTKAITIDSSIILTTPKLAYSSSKLTSLLNDQKDAIHGVLGSSVDLGTYTPANEALYTDGSWYAAQLIPTDQANQDQLVVIMHKEDNTWKVVAGPKIVLEITNYPSVPENIIRNINNLPHGQTQQ